jgi:sugar/nucleoside kinase (ribokinase family)
MPHVVCVGDVMVDVLARLPGPLAVGSDTPAPVTFAGGGAAANVACWLAWAGVSARFVGRVGADAAGREAVERLRHAGVTPAVTVDEERPTGTCIVLVGPDGERTMIPSAGANSGLGVVDVAEALPARADALYVSGYALLDAGARPFAVQAIAVARSRDWVVAVDAASAAPLAAAGEAAFGTWVGRPSMVFANDDEARVLTGATDGDAARVLATQFGEAVVKSGPSGAAWSDGRDAFSAAAAPVDAVDTTGAGDAFAAGFLHARLCGGTPADWLQRGAEVAAHAVQAVGARPPSRP